MKDLLKKVYENRAVRKAALLLLVAVGGVVVYHNEKVGALCDQVPACKALFAVEVETPAPEAAE